MCTVSFTSMDAVVMSASTLSIVVSSESEVPLLRQLTLSEVDAANGSGKPDRLRFRFHDVDAFETARREITGRVPRHAVHVAAPQAWRTSIAATGLLTAKSGAIGGLASSVVVTVEDTIDVDSPLVPVCLRAAAAPAGDGAPCKAEMAVEGTVPRQRLATRRGDSAAGDAPPTRVAQQGARPRDGADKGYRRSAAATAAAAQPAPMVPAQKSAARVKFAQPDDTTSKSSAPREHRAAPGMNSVSCSTGGVVDVAAVAESMLNVVTTVVAADSLKGRRTDALVLGDVAPGRGDERAAPVAFDMSRGSRKSTGRGPSRRADAVVDVDTTVAVLSSGVPTETQSLVAAARTRSGIDTVVVSTAKAATMPPKTNRKVASTAGGHAVPGTVAELGQPPTSLAEERSHKFEDPAAAPRTAVFTPTATTTTAPRPTGRRQGAAFVPPAATGATNDASAADFEFRIEYPDDAPLGEKSKRASALPISETARAAAASASGSGSSASARHGRLPVSDAKAAVPTAGAHVRQRGADDERATAASHDAPKPGPPMAPLAELGHGGVSRPMPLTVSQATVTGASVPCFGGQARRVQNASSECQATVNISRKAEAAAVTTSEVTQKALSVGLSVESEVAATAGSKTPAISCVKSVPQTAAGTAKAIAEPHATVRRPGPGGTMRSVETSAVAVGSAAAAPVDANAHDTVKSAAGDARRSSLKAASATAYPSSRGGAGGALPRDTCEPSSVHDGDIRSLKRSLPTGAVVREPPVKASRVPSDEECGFEIEHAAGAAPAIASSATHAAAAVLRDSDVKMRFAASAASDGDNDATVEKHVIQAPAGIIRRRKVHVGSAVSTATAPAIAGAPARTMSTGMTEVAAIAANAAREHKEAPSGLRVAQPPERASSGSSLKRPQGKLGGGPNSKAEPAGPPAARHHDGTVAQTQRKSLVAHLTGNSELHGAPLRGGSIAPDDDPMPSRSGTRGRAGTSKAPRRSSAVFSEKSDLVRAAPRVQPPLLLLAAADAVEFRRTRRRVLSRTT